MVIDVWDTITKNIHSKKYPNYTAEDMSTGKNYPYFTTYVLLINIGQWIIWQIELVITISNI